MIVLEISASGQKANESEVVSGRLCAFLAQGFLTFGANRLSKRHALRYLILQGSAMGANSTAMAALVDRVGLPLLVAQVFVTATITGFVYILSKTWVYR